jgi:hypothetical protein
MKKLCPKVMGECLEHGCVFYVHVPAKPEEFVCNDILTTMMLNDVGNYLSLLLRSGEQHRETVVQGMRSGMKGEPTPELLRLVGIQDAKNNG